VRKTVNNEKGSSPPGGRPVLEHSRDYCFNALSAEGAGHAALMWLTKPVVDRNCSLILGC
jgi:hypothetical protein